MIDYAVLPAMLIAAVEEEGELTEPQRLAIVGSMVGIQQLIEHLGLDYTVQKLGDNNEPNVH